MSDIAGSSTFDLVLERDVRHRAIDVWRCWTNPTLLVKWFTPDPWRTTEAEIDLRPGGIFRTVMEGPDGERNEGSGCVLIAEPGKLFVWTSGLGPGFRPQDKPDGGFLFTAIVEFEDLAEGSRIKATGRHANQEDARLHEEMGFHAGWGAALDQLLDVIDGKR